MSAGDGQPPEEQRDFVRLCLISGAPEGVRAFFRGQFTYLHAHGFRSTVITPSPVRDSLELPEETEYYSAPLVRAVTPLQDLRAIWRLYRLLRRGRYDLVQYTTPKGALLGSIAAFLARVPVRLYLLWGVYYVGQTGLKRRLFKLFDWLSCRLSTHVSLDGFDIRRFAVEEGLCREDNSSVVGNGSDNGIDLEYFDYRKRHTEGKAVRKQWSIPEDAVVVGSVMRLVGDKGINELVAAFDQISRNRPTLYMLLVVLMEEDKDRPWPETLDTLRNHPRMVSTGYQADIAAYYAAMDVFALPTYREGFSAVNLEAAAMALPVVTTDAIGARESVVDGVTGKVVAVQHVQELSDALAELVDDPALRRRMGEAGCRRVEQDFEQKTFWEALRRHREDLLITRGLYERKDGCLVRRV